MLTNYYKVNPWIFMIMYSVKSVIFWWTVALIIKNIIRRNWNVISGLVLLNVSTNVSPWVYVWICGENHPWWYSYMVYFVGGWGLCYLAWDIRRRLKVVQEGTAQPGLPSPATAQTKEPASSAPVAAIEEQASQAAPHEQEA